MKILRQKEFGLFSIFKEKREAKIKEREDQEKLNALIESNFKWAIDYISQVDEKMNKENSILRKFNSDFVKCGLPEEDYVSCQVYFDDIGNEITDISEFIANLRTFEDSVLCPTIARYIKYCPEKNKLCLYEGFPIAWGIDHSKDKLILEINNLTDLKNVMKKYYFLDILNNKVMKTKKTFVDLLTEWCCYDYDDEIDQAQLQKTLGKYYDEVVRFIKWIK